MKFLFLPNTDLFSIFFQVIDETPDEPMEVSGTSEPPGTPETETPPAKKRGRPKKEAVAKIEVKPEEVEEGIELAEQGNLLRGIDNCKLVYDRNHYFGLSPIPKPKLHFKGRSSYRYKIMRNIKKIIFQENYK